MYRDTTNVKPEMQGYTANNWSYRNNKIHYKRQLYLERHTIYGKYCSLNVEVLVVGITAGSRELPGRKDLCQEKTAYSEWHDYNYFIW